LVVLHLFQRDQGLVEGVFNKGGLYPLKVNEINHRHDEAGEKKEPDAETPDHAEPYDTVAAFVSVPDGQVVA
jgi:hypothetical protein